MATTPKGKKITLSFDPALLANPGVIAPNDDLLGDFSSVLSEQRKLMQGLQEYFEKNGVFVDGALKPLSEWPGNLYGVDHD